MMKCHGIICVLHWQARLAECIHSYMNHWLTAGQLTS